MADELEVIAGALVDRVGLELPERELIRVASLVLDDLREDGYDVVYTYPTETEWTQETADDD